MSVCVTISVSVLISSGSLSALGGMVAAAALAAAQSMGLEQLQDAAQVEQFANSVDLCVNNTEEVSSGLSMGDKMVFRGKDVMLVFYLDEDGRATVRVSGNQSEEELRRLGDTMAKKVVQQFAYHRIVTEMRERNMNIVEEEVEDGTVRMLVRVRQG